MSMNFHVFIYYEGKIQLRLCLCYHHSHFQRGPLSSICVLFLLSRFAVLSLICGCLGFHLHRRRTMYCGHFFYRWQVYRGLKSIEDVLLGAGTVFCCNGALMNGLRFSARHGNSRSFNGISTNGLKIFSSVREH